MHHAIHTSASLICSSDAAHCSPAHAVGCFKLQPRHALTLTIRMPGELQIAHGQVWVTLRNASGDASIRGGDHFLHTGEVLKLARGQQVVMESVGAQSESSLSASAYFSWVPDAAVSRAVLPRPVQTAHMGVRQPLRDLGLALHLAGNALGRLVQGLAAGLAGTLVPPRITATCTNQSCLTIRN